MEQRTLDANIYCQEKRLSFIPFFLWKNFHASFSTKAYRSTTSFALAWHKQCPKLSRWPIFCLLWYAGMPNFWNKFPINSFHLSVKNNVYVSSDAHTKNKVQKISKFLLENSERIIWEKHNSHHCILSSFCHWHILSLSVRHKRFRLQFDLCKKHYVFSGSKKLATTWNLLYS